MTTGDKLEVGVAPSTTNKGTTVVTWYRNGTVLYTYNDTATQYQLGVDTSLYTPPSKGNGYVGARITDVWLCSGTPPSVGGGSGPVGGSGATGGSGNGSGQSMPVPGAPQAPQTVVSGITIYIGNLYEEELNGSPNPPYTSYYSFQGKLVGLRRANYTEGNGQFRIVGDHLGSTTLVLDTASPPNAVNRQYYKPYGEVAVSSGTSRTSIGYTGQRLDAESGLLYYGARFYDSSLSYFASADIVVDDPQTSQSLNRYAYVGNNPLKYTDPTGYCKYDGSDVDKLDCTVDDFDKMTADQRIAWLLAFSKKFGYGDAFNSIIGVIEYFRDSSVIHFTPGKSWKSLADAAVLLAIQAGQTVFQGGKPVPLPGTQAEIAAYAAAAADWAAFFKAYHNNGGDWNANNNQLLRLYGKAEQAGETLGVDYATNRRSFPGGEEGAVITAFIVAGNGTREAQRNGDFGVWFINQNDPRNRDGVRRLAKALEAATVAAYRRLTTPVFIEPPPGGIRR